MNREIKFRAFDGVDMIMNPLNFPELYKVDGLMQYTGLKDKKGTEVYEDDILKFHDHPTGAEDGVGSVYYKDGKWMITWSMIPLGDFGSAWIEVIGNIHQHPELLNNSK